jgi:hypothetical protein
VHPSPFTPPPLPHCCHTVCRRGHGLDPLDPQRCLPCPTNTYAPANGGTSCLACPIDGGRQLVSGVGADRCVTDCPVGTTTSPDGSCTCSPGTFLSWDRLSCGECWQHAASCTLMLTRHYHGHDPLHPSHQQKRCLSGRPAASSMTAVTKHLAPLLACTSAACVSVAAGFEPHWPALPCPALPSCLPCSHAPLAGVGRARCLWQPKLCASLCR